MVDVINFHVRIGSFDELVKGLAGFVDRHLHELVKDRV